MEALHLTLPARAAAAYEARVAVSDFARRCGAVNGTVADIALAVSEAVTNAIVHAYRDREGAGDVVVTAERAGATLDVCVRDDGVGLTPRAESPGIGVGLALIGRVATSVELGVAAGGGALVRMRFALPRPR